MLITHKLYGQDWGVALPLHCELANYDTPAQRIFREVPNSATEKKLGHVIDSAAPVTCVAQYTIVLRHVHANSVANKIADNVDRISKNLTT
jgi:hypothetical protein